FPAHSSKVEGKAASSRSASAAEQPFSRMQRTSTSRVELTNETDCHRWPARRCSIHCRLSAASAHRPEIANCRSLMPRPRGGGERAANASGEIRGLSVPFGDFRCPYVPLLRRAGSLCRAHKRPFHRHFRAVYPERVNYVRQLHPLCIGELGERLGCFLDRVHHRGGLLVRAILASTARRARRWRSSRTCTRSSGSGSSASSTLRSI